MSVFVDCEKAFDRTKLVEILCNIGVDYRAGSLYGIYKKGNQPMCELQMVIQQHVKLVGV